MTPEEAIAMVQPVVDRTCPGEDLVVFFTEDMDPVYLGHFNTRG